MRTHLYTDVLLSLLKDTPRDKIGQNDAPIIESTITYLKEKLLPVLRRTDGPVTSEDFLTFWPPRLVRAMKDDRLICFFGAGLSLPSGLPSWAEMLGEYFGLDKSVMSDDDLQADPLTQAELAAHRLGADRIQLVLRQKLGGTRAASTGHALTAALRLPFYITTNYDELFEQAWKLINPTIKLETLTNDSDLRKLENRTTPAPDRSYLFKIHGSLDRPTEHLILTRSDYRKHYRSNAAFFRTITNLLSTKHVIFLGFGHRDPEVTRLVEDAIWMSEKHGEEEDAQASIAAVSTHELQEPKFDAETDDAASTNFYSMQFSMRSHTPEIFAARGIVALEPPLADPTVGDFRSSALTRALADLIAERQTDLPERLALDAHLDYLTRAISDPLVAALKRMGKCQKNTLKALGAGKVQGEWFTQLRRDLDVLAGQGLYLLNEQGRVIACDLPSALTSPERPLGGKEGFAARPYFRQATTYRRPFVSDSFPSIFNRHSTIAICYPVITAADAMAGLLFSACQIGAWDAPLVAAQRVWSERPDASVLVVDANGVALLPPNNELHTSEYKGGGESPEANVGFPYARLVALSRRDRLIGRVMENIVPLRQDDDVLSLGADVKQYSVVRELRTARWKVAVSDAVFLSAGLQL